MSTATATRDSRSKRHARPRTAALWAARVALAAMFLGAGGAKLGGSPEMVDMFAKIGAGQWFRYVVGGLEIAGAIGLLVPRLAGLAALGLAAVMVGATVTNLLILEASPVLPVVLLVVAGLIARVERQGRTRGRVGESLV